MWHKTVADFCSGRLGMCVALHERWGVFLVLDTAIEVFCKNTNNGHSLSLSGSGCSMDQTHVWSSSKCGTNQFMAVAGARRYKVQRPVLQIFPAMNHCCMIYMSHRLTSDPLCLTAPWGATGSKMYRSRRDSAALRLCQRKVEDVS